MGRQAYIHLIGEKDKYPVSFFCLLIHIVYIDNAAEINFQKFLKFLKPFSVVKRFQTSKDTLEVLKNQNRGTLSHTPQAFKKA